MRAIAILPVLIGLQIQSYGAGSPDFVSEVQPLLEAKCVRCHGAGKDQGELRLHTLEDMLKGGAIGPSLVPGDAEKSELVYRIGLHEDEEEAMPQKDTSFNEAEVATIAAWVAAGAEWPEGVRLKPAKREKDDGGTLLPTKVAESAAEAAGELDRIMGVETDGKFSRAKEAGQIDDLQFLRRVSLDLIGRIPSVKEIEEFQSWSEGERREKLVDRLLSAERFNDRWSVFLADMMRIRSNLPGGSALLAHVHQSLANEKPYDELAREMISANGRVKDNAAIGFILGDDANPMELAAATSQIFLGVRIGCAECHDHPFDDWNQKQFYELASFFGKTQKVENDFARSVYTTEGHENAVMWPPERSNAPKREEVPGLYAEGKGAPYAQLMWSHCQKHLRHVNTAIREGYQSVKDYWPDSEEAILAEFMIGRSLKDIGEVEEAAAVFGSVAEAHPKHRVAFLSQMEMLDLARLGGNKEERVRILEDLTFRIERTESSKEHCVNASRELAGVRVYAGDLEGARQALATTYKEDDLPRQIYEASRDPIRNLYNNEETRERSVELADQLIRQQEAVDDGEAQYRVAALYGASRRGDEQLKTYEKIAKSGGLDDRLRGSYASYHRGRKEIDKAVEWYLKYEDQVEGHRIAGELCRKAGNFARGLEVYEALIPLDGGRASEYYFAIGECYDRLKDYRKAIGSYRLADNFPHNYYRMASSHRRLKEWGEALALYHQCKAKPENEPESMLQIAFTLEESGKKEDAIASFQATCRAHPKSGQASRAHSHLQDKYGISITLGGAKEE